MTCSDDHRNSAWAHALKQIIREAFGHARRALKRGAAELEAVAPHLEKAAIWGKRQHERIAPQVPTAKQIEAWAKENAARFGWNEKPRSNSLEHLESVLTSVVAAVRQDSEKRTRIFVNVVIGKTAGVAAVSGIAAFISAFGAAGTGTAIGVLNGAAATTAQLYWVGSIFGLGAAAGGIILAGAGLGIGIGGGLIVRRRLLGLPRKETDFKDHEKAILVACITLIKALRQQIESGIPATRTEMRIISEHALIPLANQINQFWSQKSLEEENIVGCQPFTQTLAYLQRRKLDRCRTELGRIAISALAAQQ